LEDRKGIDMGNVLSFILIVLGLVGLIWGFAELNSSGQFWAQKVANYQSIALLGGIFLAIGIATKAIIAAIESIPKPRSESAQAKPPKEAAN